MSSTQLLLIAVFIASMIIMSLNYGKHKKRVIIITNENVPEVLTGEVVAALRQNIIVEGVEHRFIIDKIVSVATISQLAEKVEIVAAHKSADIIILNLTSSQEAFFIDEMMHAKALIDDIFGKCIAQKIEVIVSLSLLQSAQHYAEEMRADDVIASSANMHNIPLIRSGLENHLKTESVAKQIWKFMSITT